MASLAPRAVAALSAAPLPVERLERVWAWGRAASVVSYVFRPQDVDDIREVLALARERRVPIGLRGAGQSYGDAALNAERICMDTSGMRRVLAWDPEAGVIRVEPGVTIGDLWRLTVEEGWWPPVVPGTMNASIGGAAAMNVHGKNNWKAGPIGEHILEFDILLPDGTLRSCSPTAHGDLFYAAIGGFGMLGCIVSLTMQLKRVDSGRLQVEALAAPSLDGMLAAFEERLDSADYLVGWIDCFARGPALGRGLVHAATYLGPGEDPEAIETMCVRRQELPRRLFGVVPRGIIWWLARPLVNDLGVRLTNSAKYHLGKIESGHRYRQPHAQFHFLLDYIPEWRRAYGPGGLIQYQSLVPAARAAAVFREQLVLVQRRGILPYIGVLKRHRADPFLMTHALDGYSLAMDFKVTPARRQRLWALAAELDRIVLDAGGRFYFAKDSTLAAERLGGYFAEERVQRFLSLKRLYDPEGLLQTDLYRRIFGGWQRSTAERP